MTIGCSTSAARHAPARRLSAGAGLVRRPRRRPAAAAARRRAVGGRARATRLTPTLERVIEDDDVRIEETRVRGQAQRITVQSKVGGAQALRDHRRPGGRDPSQDRGAAGQRAWSLFDF